MSSSIEELFWETFLCRMYIHFSPFGRTSFNTVLYSFSWGMPNLDTLCDLSYKALKNTNIKYYVCLLLNILVYFINLCTSKNILPPDAIAADAKLNQSFLFCCIMHNLALLLDTFRIFTLLCVPRFDLVMLKSKSSNYFWFHWMDPFNIKTHFFKSGNFSCIFVVVELT